MILEELKTNTSSEALGKERRMTQQEASGPDMGAELSQGTLHRQVMPMGQIGAFSQSVSHTSRLLPLATKTQQDNQEEREWGLVL